MASAKPSPAESLRAAAGVVVNSARSVAAGGRLADELPDAVYVAGDIAEPDTALALDGAEARIAV